MSEDTGFTFNELYGMSMSRLLMMKDIKDQIIEERNKAQEEAQEQAKSNKVSPSSFSASSIKSLASKYGVSMPSGLHL